MHPRVTKSNIQSTYKRGWDGLILRHEERIGAKPLDGFALTDTVSTVVAFPLAAK